MLGKVFHSAAKGLRNLPEKGRQLGPPFKKSNLNTFAPKWDYSVKRSFLSTPSKIQHLNIQKQYFFDGYHQQYRNSIFYSKLQNWSTSKRNFYDLRKMLNANQKQILEKETNLLKEVQKDLEDMRASKDDADLLQRSIDQLEDLFLLVIVGEFNSGKSSFLNALLGKKYLKEGVTPTTSKIGILKYGDKIKLEQLSAEREVIALPVEWLKDISLVDTPGTNAVVKGHQQITEHFVPRSDLVIFLTSSDRPFSESERQFLQLIRQWKKKVVVVVSKVDMVDSDAELAEIINFVRNSFVELLDFEPIIFPVSGKFALSAKVEFASNKEALEASPKWKLSRFGELETYILKTLSQEERTKLKMENPLGVLEYLLSKYSSAIVSRKEVLKGDIQTLQTIQQQIEEFRKDMVHDFQYQHDRADKLLLLMGQRGEKYLDDKVTVTNMLEIFKSEKIRIDFEREVVGDTSVDIEKQVSDVIDWMITKTSRLWKDTMEFVQRRSTMNSPDIMGKIQLMSFDYNRANLLQSIGQSSSKVVASFDRQKEATKLSGEVKQALMTTAALEVGALGIGGLLAVSLLDLSGILGISVLAATGLAILPYKRASLKSALQVKVNELRDRLKSTLSSHFNQELEHSIRKLEDAIEPYTRFVKTEKDKLETLEKKFTQYQKEVEQFRASLERAFTTKKE